MGRHQLLLTSMAAGMLLSACSSVQDVLWTSAAEPAPPPAPLVAIAEGNRTSEEGTAAQLSLPPPLGATDFEVAPPRSGEETGTYVGSKVLELREDLMQLQASLNHENTDLQEIRRNAVNHARTYHERVAGIRSRLQLGTTPGNPKLVAAWSEAQEELEQVNADIGRMNELANRVAADAAMSSYLLESTRASFGLSGAIDEDHRQLAVLGDDVSRTVVVIERLLLELSDDIRRQSNYVTNERSELNILALAIKTGEFFGGSLALAGNASSRYPVASSPEPAGTAPRRVAEEPGSRHPLIVIRFDRPDVDYQQALYTAVNQTLRRNPDATFDLVAVSAAQGGTATATLNESMTRRNAQAVLRTLVDMGLPPSRVSLSARTSAGSANEARLYLR